MEGRSIELEQSDRESESQFEILGNDAWSWTSPQDGQLEMNVSVPLSVRVLQLLNKAIRAMKEGADDQFLHRFYQELKCLRSNSLNCPETMWVLSDTVSFLVDVMMQLQAGDRISSASPGAVSCTPSRVHVEVTMTDTVMEVHAIFPKRSGLVITLTKAMDDLTPPFTQTKLLCVNDYVILDAVGTQIEDQRTVDTNLIRQKLLLSVLPHFPDLQAATVETPK